MTHRNSKREDTKRMVEEFISAISEWAFIGAHRPEDWPSIERRATHAIRGMVEAISGGEHTMTRGEVYRMKRKLRGY